jgi:hypothetical protein
MAKKLEELLKEQEDELLQGSDEATDELNEEAVDDEASDEVDAPEAELEDEEDAEEVEEAAYPSIDFQKEKVKGGKGGKAVYPTVDFKKSVAKGGAQQPGKMAKVDFKGDRDGNTNKKTPVDPESYPKVRPNFEPEVVANMTREDISDETRAHLASLFAGEELSEEFIAKVQEIFEAAVIVTAQEALNAKVKEIVEKYEASFETVLETAEAEVETYKQELNEKSDAYFDYVVEQWVEENKPAVHANIKSDLTESFIKGLQNLFVEHYIDIPDDKVEVVEEMVEELEALRDRNEEILHENLQLKTEAKNVVKSFLIREHTKDLSENEREKFQALAEHISFDDEKSFQGKLSEISDTYFNESVVVESSLEDDTPLETIEEEVKPVGKELTEVESMAAMMTKFLKK